jgi:hypothetical protein
VRKPLEAKNIRILHLPAFLQRVNKRVMAILSTELYLEPIRDLNVHPSNPFNALTKSRDCLRRLQ